MIYAAFGLLAVIVLVLAYQYMVRPAMHTTNERFSSPSKRLVFLHMTGCGWCVRFMPTWDAFVAKYAETLRSQGVDARKIEASEPAAKEFDVRSYPTVLLVIDGGRTIKFEGERTEAGLRGFLVTNGVSLVEGFVSRPVTAGQQTLQDAKSNVSNNTGDPNVTKSMSNTAGMKTKQKS